MKATSFVLLAAITSGTTIRPLPAQSKPVSSNVSTRISDAEANEDGTVQIRFNNGRSIQVPPEKGQAGREQLQVARNGRFAGWFVTYNGFGASYAIPLTLTIYAVGKPLKHFGDLMLLDWDFVDDDKHVRFSSSQTHGRGADWRIVEVHDIDTGRLLERWLEPSDSAFTDSSLATVRGSVTDGGGSLVPDAVVSILPAPAPESIALTTSAQTISTKDGSFTLRGIWPGQHELQVEHPRFKKRIIKITVGPDVEAVETGAVTLERQAPRSRH